MSQSTQGATAADAFGKLAALMSFIIGAIVWVYTIAEFMSEERVELAALTFFAPPIVLITAWLPDTPLPLGGMAVGAALLAIPGMFLGGKS